jgi:L-fucose isomerase-like protein
LNIVDTGYDDLAKRIQSAKGERRRLDEAAAAAEAYLDLKGTRLETDKRFLVNAFILYGLFKDILRDYTTDAFTINECMSTVIPMSETTACMPLSFLNDDGAMAFCESDFNVIPAGILLRTICGKPVFLNDPTYPHAGIVTVAHCTAPRRMSGTGYAPVRVMTHFESDYGAAPKVELKKNTPITMVCPDASQKKWVGFTGTVERSPFYDICRSQYDIRIRGDWEKLLQDHRGFHWMMAVGDYSREMAYAAPKIGIEWEGIT